MYATLIPIPGTDASKSIVIRLGATQEPPASFSTTLDEAAKGAVLADVRFIDHTDVAPARDPSVYAFTKRDDQRNLYRIPLH